MKPFHAIAVPHRDILEGRLTMDVFAADLWEVFNGRGPDEYKDKESFFAKTYETEGLKKLLSIAEQRLKGRGGAPFIQLQTPFGGGKTHALIALYHKATEWKANPVVIVGTALNASDTLWGALEQQLTGKIKHFRELTAPGGEALRAMISQHQPVLILMDEVLQYVTRAAGIAVGSGTLADQTIAFMHALTETPGKLERVSLVISLPSSVSQQYGQDAQRLYRDLEGVTGRVERIYAPVEDDEIAQVIRQRLFSSIDVESAEDVVNGYIDYVSKEGILPRGSEASQYRKRFESAYPFCPEAIDVLYQRWGSFPEFQRTRGALRLLSLVIYSLKDSLTPYISLADFDLDNQDVRWELVKHIGQPFDSVISMDITGIDSGAKKIDATLGDAFRGLHLGTRVATTIFLYSFSGGVEQPGAEVRDIKRSATTIDNPASVVAEAVEQLRNNLAHLHHDGDKYYFTNQPSLYQLLLTKMENVSPQQVEQFENQLLKQSAETGPLSAYIWRRESSEIPDTDAFKLVILKSLDDDFMRQVLQTKGESPRVNQNTLFFLAPLSIERETSFELFKRHLAYRAINDDRNVNLSDEQRIEVKEQLGKSEEDAREALRRYYRRLFVPGKDEFKEIDLGIPTYGETSRINQEIYRKLLNDKELINSIAPEVIKLKYLSIKDFVSTLQLYTSSLTTPGELKFSSRDVLTDGISQGVEQGLFGLGSLADGKPVCTYFKKSIPVYLMREEVIIRAELCLEEASVEEGGTQEGQERGEQGGQTQQRFGEGEIERQIIHTQINLSFPIPRKGHMADIIPVIRLLQEKFQDISLTLRAQDGEISEQELEDKVREAFRQLDLEIMES